MTERFGFLDVVRAFEKDLVTFDPELRIEVEVEEPDLGTVVLRRGKSWFSSSICIDTTHWGRAVMAFDMLFSNADVFNEDEWWPVCPHSQSDPHVLSLKARGDAAHWYCGLTNHAYAKVGELQQLAREHDLVRIVPS